MNETTTKLKTYESKTKWRSAVARQNFTSPNIYYMYVRVLVFKNETETKKKCKEEEQQRQWIKKKVATLQTHTKVLNLIANADVQPSYYRNIESNKRCVSGGTELYICVYSQLKIEWLSVNIFRDVCLLFFFRFIFGFCPLMFWFL